MKKNRVQYIDIARGIAIICIIIGHLDNYQIVRVVYTFHVPIFFFITGYFTSANLPIKKFIKNKVHTLMLPYMYASLALIIMNTLKSFVFIGSNAAKDTFLEWVYAAIYGAGVTIYQPFYIRAIGALWFLWATFWGSIFLRFLLSVRGERIRIALVLVLFFAGYWSRNLFWFPFSIQAGFCATLFLYLGYLVRISREYFQKVPMEVKAFGTILALFFWINFINNYQSFALVCCEIGRGMIDIFSCICACYIIILVSRYIENHISVFSKFFSFCGKNSLLVLCIHNTEHNVLPWWEVSQKLVNHGMPESFRLYFFIVAKIILIMVLTVIFAKLQSIKMPNKH